ncbi:hypothetical protein OSB04_016452 [Centaurea solstitialis]|uniref:Integrase catalytic domain-containing protein n=1 Tax=Centaurea solstitialis TaxID=347529 RepID=A0AA38W9T6_9ASTR|nr:hypothetical protein OSB04_016452 [Centaurea solstitialis]
MLLLHESREESLEPHTDPPLTSSAALYSSAQNGKPKNKTNRGRNNGRFASRGAILVFPQAPILLQVHRVTPRLTLETHPPLAMLHQLSQAYLVHLLCNPLGQGLLSRPRRCSVLLSSPHPTSSICHQCLHIHTITSNTSLQIQYPFLLSMAMSVQAPQDNNFYTDSGATRHMNFNQGTMHSPTPCNSNFIQVGNGDMVPARYTGQCTLPYSLHPLHLKNVLVSDKLIKNLISVRRFTIDNYVSVEFDPFGFTVKDLKTWSFLQRCDSDHHDLYPVLPPAPRSALASANVVVSYDVWHRRLGHPGAAIFQFLVSRKFIACSSQTFTLCHACQLEKHCRLPFSLSTTKTSRVFELIHSDLSTSPITSLSGFKYYVLFLDDFPHFLWVFPLRAKSEVFSVFKTFRAYVLNQFKTNIQLFQYDNGREFNNQPFLDFFKTHGIKMRFSCPYTSPQNGKGERTIHTINNTLRMSLIQASPPPKFWVEALLSSVHTFNLLSSTTIQYKTPFEVLFGFSPTCSHLRVFGCLCYPNTAPTAPHKLAPRSSACVYLGPSTDHRGYRCLDLITQKMDRNDWMYQMPRATHEYLAHVDQFTEVAENNRLKNGESDIWCPCRDCRNICKYSDHIIIKEHLIVCGFMEQYTCWVHHGEDFDKCNYTLDQDCNDTNDHFELDNDSRDNLDEMLHDVEDDIADKDYNKFEQLFIDSEKPLYVGCSKFTKLSAVLKLFNLKANNGWSDNSFTSLLEILYEMFPEDNELPVLLYQAKKIDVSNGIRNRENTCMPK